MKENSKVKEHSNGITLIALVITIIVLLILAGVTITTLAGDNGILTKATEAKEEQADATVKEAISIAWNEYQIIINETTGKTIENETKIASTETIRIQGQAENYLAIPSMSFLDFLREEKKYIDENGVINVKELIGETLSKGNGTDGVTDVYKIEEEADSYILKYYNKNGDSIVLWQVANNPIEGNVEIEVTRFPESETEKTDSVVITITSVKINGEEQKIQLESVEEYEEMLKNELATMSGEERAKLLLDIFIAMGNPMTEEEIIEALYSQNIISEPTQEAYYIYLGSETGIEELVRVIENSNYNLIGKFDPYTLELINYNIINPDEHSMNSYIAIENGEYIFKIEIYNKEGGKSTITKKVVVENIDNSTEYENNYYIKEIEFGKIGLIDKTNDEKVTFSNAYIFYNNTWEDISDYIINTGDYTYLEGNRFFPDMKAGVRDIILVKDGQKYYGKVVVQWPI